MPELIKYLLVWLIIQNLVALLFSIYFKVLPMVVSRCLPLLLSPRLIYVYGTTLPYSTCYRLGAQISPKTRREDSPTTE